MVNNGFYAFFQKKSLRCRPERGQNGNAFMTEKELRKLNRAELLELLIWQIRENEAQQTELEDLRARLQRRELAMQEAGSIAEAALRLQGVFEAAQAAADQYLESVKALAERAKTAEQPPSEERQREG